VPYPHNGFVDGYRTVFHATGKSDEVAGFLRSVCERVSNLPLDRLDHESRVLRTEAAGRSTGATEAMLWLRYGAQGWGMLQLPEFGLEAPDPGVVAAWAGDHFTASNAIVWLSGPIPKGLHLPLPIGERTSPPPAVPIEDLALPSWTQGPSGGVAVAFTTSRKDWFGPILTIVQRRLQQALRHDHGISYSVDSGVMPLNADTSHSILVATGLDEHAADIARSISDVLQAMAVNGLSDEEIDVLVDGFDRYESDPDAVYSWLDSGAANELVGFQSATPQKLRAELRALTASTSSEVVQRAFGSALMRLPPGVDGSGKWLHDYPAWSTMAVEGRTYRSVADPYPWRHRHNVLRVGEAGVSVVTPERRAVTVLFDSVAGLIVRPDHRFLLHGADGFVLSIAPEDWVGGDKAVREIWDRLPADLVLDLSEPSWGRKPLPPKVAS